MDQINFWDFKVIRSSDIVTMMIANIMTETWVSITVTVMVNTSINLFIHSADVYPLYG